MAQLTPVEIFQVLREAGFTPDQAVNFTAIAMAESGGDPHARLNTSAEDSRGLWQINLHAHANYANANLYDPLTNAKAAYDISGHGTNLYPWSTTHHGHGGSASYEKFLPLARHAEAAAATAGPFHDPGGADAGSHGTGHVRPIEHGVLTDSWHAPRPGGHVHEGIDIFAPAGTPIHAVAGGTIVRGFSDPRGGVVVRIQGDDGNYYYYAHLKPGSIGQLHVGEHVAVGDVLGQVGNSGDAATTPSHLHLQVMSGGRWIDPYTFLQPFPDMSQIQSAGMLDGAGADPSDLSAAGHGTDAAAVGAAAAGAHDPYGAGAKPFVDSDHDGLSDDFEKLVGTDPHSADSDHDGLSDYQEVVVTRTDPLSADTDHNSEGDALAVALGHDPGHVPLSPAAQAALLAGGAAVGVPGAAAGGGAASAATDELTSGFESATGIGGAGAPGTSGVSAVYDPHLGTGSPSTALPAAIEVQPDGSVLIPTGNGEVLHLSLEHADPSAAVDAHLADPGTH